MRKPTIIAILLGMPLLSQAQTPQNSWAQLNTLRAGQKIEIIETSLKTHSGRFSTVTDEAIQLREGESNVGIKKENVIRVTLLAKSHRLRNALISAAVGAGAGAGIGAATHHHNNGNCITPCQTPNTFLTPRQAAAIGAVLGLSGGAAIGAAIPSHPTVYRSEQR